MINAPPSLYATALVGDARGPKTPSFVALRLETTSLRIRTVSLSPEGLLYLNSEPLPRGLRLRRPLSSPTHPPSTTREWLRERLLTSDKFLCRSALGARTCADGAGRLAPKLRTRMHLRDAYVDAANAPDALTPTAPRKWAPPLSATPGGLIAAPPLAARRSRPRNVREI